jgi:hypothetical protein
VAISYQERNWRTRSNDCLQNNSSARTPRITPSSFVKDVCLQLCFLSIDVLLFRAFAWRGQHRKQFSLYCCHILRGVFTGRHIETAVLLLLSIFVVVRMFTDTPLLLRNLATDCLSRICLRGNLVSNPLPGNAFTCHNKMLNGFQFRQSQFRNSTVKIQKRCVSDIS